MPRCGSHRGHQHINGCTNSCRTPASGSGTRHGNGLIKGCGGDRRATVPRCGARRASQHEPGCRSDRRATASWCGRCRGSELVKGCGRDRRAAVPRCGRHRGRDHITGRSDCRAPASGCGSFRGNELVLGCGHRTTAPGGWRCIHLNTSLCTWRRGKTGDITRCSQLTTIPGGRSAGRLGGWDRRKLRRFFVDLFALPLRQILDGDHNTARICIHGRRLCIEFLPARISAVSGRAALGRLKAPKFDRGRL